LLVEVDEEEVYNSVFGCAYLIGSKLFLTFAFFRFAFSFIMQERFFESPFIVRVLLWAVKHYISLTHELPINFIGKPSLYPLFASYFFFFIYVVGEDFGFFRDTLLLLNVLVLCIRKPSLSRSHARRTRYAVILIKLIANGSPFMTLSFHWAGRLASFSIAYHFPSPFQISRIIKTKTY